MPKLITLDYETYYSKEFSLSKMTTEQYIRHPDFEVIGVGVKVNDGETEWASGTYDELKDYLYSFDWSDSILLAQNTIFDGAILHWHYDITPKGYADTMCMSKAWDGVHVSASLAKQAERHLRGAKGTYVSDAIGKRRKDFTPKELALYGDYCIQDVELTYQLFRHYMRQGFPKAELKVIDMTIAMFAEPRLELDVARLNKHLSKVKERKEKLLEAVNVTKKELMSANKFADLLTDLGVIPPTKLSPTTGKETFAFAKTDEGFKRLLEHDDDRVQALANARLGNKSTLEESRTERFIGIASRGKLPGPIAYYAAHTGRWGGTDKINLQNLPSRGPNGKVLKKTIMAPEGYVCIVGDSSQIEARIVAWLAGQQDLVDAFARGDDVYISMAAKIYNKAEEDVTASERFIGKMTILGCGYNMGAQRFRDQLKSMANVDISLDESTKIVHIYRETNYLIKRLWRSAGDTIEYMTRGQALTFGRVGVLSIDVARPAVILPNGLPQHYPDIRVLSNTSRGPQFGYTSRKGAERLYGGKLVENVCQGLAKIIIAEQMLKIRAKYPTVLTVHDSVVALARVEETKSAKAYVEQCLRHVPDWATGLPLDCEVDTNRYYGECDA